MIQHSQDGVLGNLLVAFVLLDLDIEHVALVDIVQHPFGATEDVVLDVDLVVGER